MNTQVSRVGEASPTLEGVLMASVFCDEHGLVALTDLLYGDGESCPICEQEAEDEFWAFEDRGCCPVCSLEQGRDVEIPPGETCACGGFTNESEPDVQIIVGPIDETVTGWRPV